jgi:secondary thiamine-phosphate synthase enzyme
MAVITQELSITTSGYRTHEVTGSVAEILNRSGMKAGTATIFCRHTSCSLVIMENADPSARRDLEAYLSRLVPENDPAYTHTAEGPDDMPSHIKMALTRTSETVPFADNRLLLGTWQGIFLWEHRARPHRRQLIVSLQGE